jgi:EmrB/QacA subfamily drug resistance transporter
MAPDVHRRRWVILGVLSLALLVIGLDNTILNVALPTLQRDLEASNAELQWIVDAYTLVFAGLILVAGAWGDKFGRRRALFIGLAVFGAASLWGALSQDAAQLTAARALMGVGAALIMPATLSILTNTFLDPAERKTAIGIWAAVSGLGIAIGPTLGGWLLEHFAWGSVFLINIPVVLISLGLGTWLLVESRDEHASRIDAVGAGLSVVALSSLVFAIIEGPVKGWTSWETLGAAALGAAALAAFVRWELRVAEPMLDLRLFRNPRFSVPAGAVTLVFFSLFGTVFFLAIYLQAVLGYTALEAGIRMLPIAVGLIVGSPLAMAMAKRTGEKWPTVLGLGFLAAAFLVIASTTTETDYWPQIPIQMTLMAFGIAFAMGPATEAIMAAVPRAKAGVGAAVNDAVRQVGGAFGVAVLGSLLASSYASRIGDAAASLPADAAGAASDNLQGALGVAATLPPDQAGALVAAANEAFVGAMTQTTLFGLAAIVLGMVAVAVWMPSYGRDVDADAAAAAGAGGSDPRQALEAHEARKAEAVRR